MAALPTLNNIENDTPANALPVEENYNTIEQYINNSVIRIDGVNSMAAPLLLVGDPTAELHAATKQYVDAIMPVGVILPFGGLVAPSGGRWALANGASVATSTYPKLFIAFAYRFGGSGGSFNLPNLTGRVPVGRDNAAGIDADARFNTVGETGGSYTLVVPQHSHPMPHTHPINHDHAAGTTSTEPGHHHSGRFSSGADPGSGGVYYAHRLADTSGTVAAQITGEAGAHDHTFNTPNYIGDSGAVSTANTSNTGNANPTHVPPYIVLQYIVRLD